MAALLGELRSGLPRLIEEVSREPYLDELPSFDSICAAHRSTGAAGAA